MKRNPARFVVFSKRDEKPRVTSSLRPAAVYAYDADSAELLADAFRGEAPHMIIVQPTVPMINTGDFSDADLEQAFAILRDRGVPVNRIMDRWINKYRDRFPRSGTWGLPFAGLWYVVCHVLDPDSTDPDPEPITWDQGIAADSRYANRLLRAVGIEAINDPFGILAGNDIQASPHMAAFLTDQAFRVSEATSAFGIPPTLANQTWVTRAVTEFLPSDIPDRWQPARVDGELREYGCGVYGCVLPTHDPEVVLKVTTDDTEAQFARDYAGKLVVSVCVDYYRVNQISERRMGMPVSLLWREAAIDVGQLPRGDEEEELVGEQWMAAKVAYDAMELSSSRADAELDAWLEATLQMASSPGLEFLANGMIRLFREQGIFFGDISPPNLGRVRRGGRMEWCITDPGRVAVIR